MLALATVFIAGWNIWAIYSSTDCSANRNKQNGHRCKCRTLLEMTSGVEGKTFNK